MSNEIVPADDSETVIFASGGPTPGFDPHKQNEKIEKTVGELRDSYQRIVAQILAMTRDTPKDDSLRLTTVEVGLAFTAEGELGFIAKATVGVEASITLTFERPSGS
jgi:hypothetical protein